MDIKSAAEVKVREKDGGRARNPSVSNNPGKKKKDNGRQKICPGRRRLLPVGEKGGRALWPRKNEVERLPLCPPSLPPVTERCR